MGNGTIIVLNGASSSGKSSIARELQLSSEAPLVDAGLDQMVFRLGKQVLLENWMDVLGRVTEAGALGKQLITAMHRTWVTIANTGLDVVADHVMIEPTWPSECAETVNGYRAYFIGVRCAYATLKRREESRSDRTPGQACRQQEIVHQHASGTCTR